MSTNYKKIIIKLDRILAWSLVGIFVIFFITGFGITKGIIHPEFSKFLHDDLFPIPGAIAFAFHSAYGMHVAFKRWKIWNKAWLVVLIVYALAIVGGTAFFQFVIKAPGTDAIPQSIEL